MELIVPSIVRKKKLPFVDSLRTWLTLPPWEREPALRTFFHPQGVYTRSAHR